jgi:vacuolar-type H+-ATPase subunit E/Vma4
MNQSTKTIEASNIKTLAEIRANTKRTKLIKNAESFKEKQTLLANTEAEMIRANANARLSVAKDKSALLIKESVAEANAQENMNPMRKHAEKMKLNDALKTMSKNANIVLSGKNGQSLLDFYNNTITEISGR